MKRVKKTESCWIWCGAIAKSGYGTLYIGNRKQGLAHRVSFSLFNGKLKKGYFICHKCDNPSCVNPNHLFQGKQKDNMKDMVEKGRSAKREFHSQVILTEAQVEKVLQVYASRKSYFWGCKDLAIEFGVSRATISDIANKRTWTK